MLGRTTFWNRWNGWILTLALGAGGAWAEDARAQSGFALFEDPPSLEAITERAAAALGFVSANPEEIETGAIAQPVIAAEPEPLRGPDCAGGPNAFGITRIVEVDPSEGRHYGAGRSEYESTRSFLGPKEIVLTFDDGPNPRATADILKTLREFCVTATFFVPGWAAEAQPDLLAEIAADGHTIAGHSYSHPMPFARQSFEDAVEEIERGFISLERQLGYAPASIFRFPGLSDNSELLNYLSERGIMSLSIDVDSGDTRPDATTQKVINGTLSRIERRGGGVVLFHDPLRRTARALPVILTELRERGYRIVHLVSATEYAPPGEAPQPSSNMVMSGFVLNEPAGPIVRTDWPKPSFRRIEPPLIPAVY